MKLVALMPARNEDWVLGLSLRAALRWADEVCVLLHCCTDRSRDIVEEVASECQGRVSLETLDIGGDYFPEVTIRNRLLRMGRERGGTHFALVDADEVLCGDSLGKVRSTIEALPPMHYLSVPMRPLWRDLLTLRVDLCVWTTARIVLAFSDSPDLVGWETRDGYEWHHRNPAGTVAVRDDNISGVMHLQFANWRRLRAKHAWYKMMEVLRCPRKPVAEIDAQYSMALDERGLCTVRVPSEWWKPYEDLMDKVDMGREPWFEGQVRQWWEQYGPRKFQGLDLFGLVC